MAVLTVGLIALTGLKPVLVSAAVGGDSFANNGFTYLHVNNASAAPTTVTVHGQGNCNYGVEHNAVVTVPLAEERLIGPFPPRRFNDTTSQVQVTYSVVTTITVGAFKVSG